MGATAKRSAAVFDRMVSSECGGTRERRPPQADQSPKRQRRVRLGKFLSAGVKVKSRSAAALPCSIEWCLSNSESRIRDSEFFLDYQRLRRCRLVLRPFNGTTLRVGLLGRVQAGCHLESFGSPVYAPDSTIAGGTRWGGWRNRHRFATAGRFEYPMIGSSGRGAAR